MWPSLTRMTKLLVKKVIYSFDFLVFIIGDEVTVKLSDLIDSTRLRNRVAKLSPLGQTSSLEGFHSVVNHFCPKMIHFSYNAMGAR